MRDVSQHATVFDANVVEVFLEDIAIAWLDQQADFSCEAKPAESAGA